MTAFGGLIQTNKGRDLQAKAQTGVQLNFTRIAIGDGNLGATSIQNLNALISEKKSLSINKLKVQSDGKAVVGASFTNQDIATGFYFREIGVFAQDPDLGEILYCYGNSGSNAEFISAGGGSDLIEKYIDIFTIIGTASSVTATIDSSLVFETPAGAQEKVNLHASRTDNPHVVTHAQTNPAAATSGTSTTKDKHISNQDYKNWEDHRADSVRHITATERTTWNAKEPAITKNTAFNKNFGTTAGTVAEGNHIHLTKQYSGDLNNLKTNGIYDGQTLTNAPESGWLYIEVIPHTNNPNSYVAQRATSFSTGKTYQRVLYADVWQSWKVVGSVNYKTFRSVVARENLTKGWNYDYEVFSITGKGVIADLLFEFNNIDTNISNGLELYVDGTIIYSKTATSSGSDGSNQWGHFTSYRSGSGMLIGDGEYGTGIFPEIYFNQSARLRVYGTTTTSSSASTPYRESTLVYHLEQ